MGSPVKNQSFAVDEELWFGDHDDAEAESRAAASLAAVGTRIVGAKPFPIAARRLDELTRSQNTRIEQVVAVLESDPALSARLLRLVNSAGYGLKVRCTSMRHAAVLVGTRRLNQVATTAAILDLFDGSNSLAMELLEHAAVVGSLCRYLAVHVGLPHDELFTCGFLHDIGKLMLLDAERERYADLLEEFGHVPDQIHLAERKLFGFDHAVLGAHVLTAWNIPDPVPRVIAFHHAPQRAMQDTVVSAMVQTLRLADLLAYLFALPDAQTALQLAAESEAARYLEISDVQLAAMWDDLAGLYERSRARSHGEPELDAMVPKTEVPSLHARSSMNPSLRAGQQSGRPLHEVPAHFPCSVCGKPSYGNVCAACGGQTCPQHQIGHDEWCTVCVREYGRFKKSAELSRVARAGVGALVGGTLAVALYSASRAPDAGIDTLIFAPVLVLALWAVVLPVAYRLWQKLSFLERRRRAKGLETLSVARPQSIPIQSMRPGSSAADAPPQGSGVTTVEVSEGEANERETPFSRPEASLAPQSMPPVFANGLSTAPLSMAPVSMPPRSIAPRSVGPAAALPRSVAPQPTLSRPLERTLDAALASVMPAPSILPSGSPPLANSGNSVGPLLRDSEFFSVRPSAAAAALSAHRASIAAHGSTPRATLSPSIEVASLPPGALSLPPEAASLAPPPAAQAPAAAETREMFAAPRDASLRPDASGAPREVVAPTQVSPSLPAPSISLVPRQEPTAAISLPVPAESPIVSAAPPAAAVSTPPAPASVPLEAPQAERAASNAVEDDTPTAAVNEEGPDSGAQLVVRQPPPPRVVNSPLVRARAIGCSRTPLQACVGAPGPRISYLPPPIATPGSRESA